MASLNQSTHKAIAGCDYLGYARSEFFRPWKLATFGIGLALLIGGSFYYRAPDWDIGISILMAGLTYATAPWSVQTFVRRQWRCVPAALLAYYLSVDGIYWAYWRIVDPEALVMREANFYASTCLFWLCGFIWLHEGSVQDLFLVRQQNLTVAPPVTTTTDES